MKYIIFSVILLNGFITTCCFAKKISVGFEPFPPFVTEDGNGLSVDLLRAVEKISDLKFDINIMTYARVKHELKKQRIDIAGHLPKNIENVEFYKYGKELNWSILTHTDLFSLDKKCFKYKVDESITLGTTVGNTSFLAEMMGVSQSSFIEVSTLDQLVEMLIKGRVNVVVYERASVMTLLAQKKMSGVVYKTIGITPITMAVQNTEKGNLLKQKLDHLIQQIDLNEIFSSYFKYNLLNDEGIAPID